MALNSLYKYSNEVYENMHFMVYNRQKGCDLVHSSLQVEKLGFSQREFLTLFILRQLTFNTNYPKNIHQLLIEQFPEKVHSYDYLCKVTKQLESEGLLQILPKGRANILTITSTGIHYLDQFELRFKAKLLEIKAVIDRFVKDITGSGQATPVVQQLGEEHRLFFSKLVSVKDLVRYVTLKEGQKKRTSLYMGEISLLLKEKYGWEASNGYLYELAMEMEKEGLLRGRWESERRSKRLLTITDEGVYYYQQIANSTRERLLKIQHFLTRILLLLQN